MPEDEKQDPARNPLDLVTTLESLLMGRHLLQKHLDRLGAPYQPVPDEGVALLLDKAEAEALRMALAAAVSIFEAMVTQAPPDVIVKSLERELGRRREAEKKDRPGG